MQDIIPTQNPTTPVQASTQSVVSSVPQQAVRIIEPPEVSGHKEHAPISAAKSEFVKPVESQSEITPSNPPEIMIPQELKNTIEKGPDAKDLKIEKEIQKAGVTLAKESAPVITTPTGIIRLPMTYREARKRKNNSSFWDGVHWFTALIMYQWCKYGRNNIIKS